MNNNERVTLQYSIGLEELPEEVERLVKRASELQSNQLTSRFNKLLIAEPHEFLSTETISNIQHIRYLLSSIDITLGDVENIVEGFFSMQHQAQHATEKDVPPVIEREIDELSEGEELVEQLRLFKEKAALQNEQDPTQNPSK